MRHGGSEPGGWERIGDKNPSTTEPRLCWKEIAEALPRPSWEKPASPDKSGC